MSREVRSYNDLIAWQKGIAFVTQVYASTRAFPPEERYGLTSQIRRAAVSIPSNIAEGHGRMTRGEYLHFLGTARGSLFEVRTHIHIAKELKFLNDEESDKLLESATELGKLINGIIKGLSGSQSPTPSP
jgi:four helix bundle protein